MIFLNNKIIDIKCSGFYAFLENPLCTGSRIL